MGVAIPPTVSFVSRGIFDPNKARASPQTIQTCWISKGVSQQNSHYPPGNDYISHPKGTFEAMIFRFKKVGYVRSLEGIQQVYMFQTRTLLARPTAVAGESNEWKQCNNEFLIVFFIRPIDFLIQVSTFFCCCWVFSSFFKTICVCIFGTSIKELEFGV